MVDVKYGEADEKTQIEATMVASTKANVSAVKPHILGGSNNLLAERNRRERAENALQTTRQKLRAVAQDLTPQVLQLTEAVKV